MFTGLVQEVGVVRGVRRKAGYLLLEIGYDEGKGKLRKGDSMAVDGVCLTATRTSAGIFTADLSRSTQAGTTLRDTRIGDRVNLERALTASDPLGGHFVLGHVDGVGRVSRVLPTSGGLRIAILAPEETMGFLVDKGSVAVDGISLTVDRSGGRSFEVFLIPETQENTTLAGKKAGARVNLEADYLAKLVKNFMLKQGGGGLTTPPRGWGED